MIVCMAHFPVHSPNRTSLELVLSALNTVCVSGTGFSRRFVNGKVGSVMEGKVAEVVTYGDYKDAVVVEVSGRGHYTGKSSFWAEDEDNLTPGFLVK